MAARISCEGRVTVSERRSIREMGCCMSVPSTCDSDEQTVARAAGSLRTTRSMHVLRRRLALVRGRSHFASGTWLTAHSAGAMRTIRSHAFDEYHVEIAGADPFLAGGLIFGRVVERLGVFGRRKLDHD